ncbi:MAG TPA: TonB-dependent receptor plug domain-containing protein [Candidatus Deferrimicrobiaceae bacterium]
MLLACRLSGVGTALAADDPASALGLADETPGLPSALSPRPASKIAENVTVVSADDIARINAHTLADVLQTIPGFQLDYQRTPGTFSFINLQGAQSNTVLVLVDGVRRTDFQLGATDTTVIPVQQIERIEIVKGAASAAWGPALGGVINVVTKSPDWGRTAGGLLSGSIGRRTTADSRLELSGAAGNVGYYLTGGNLHSDGLRANNGTETNHFHGKLSWLDSSGGTLTGGYTFLDARRGTDEGMFAGTFPVHDDDGRRWSSGSLRYERPLAARLRLEVDGHLFGRDDTLEQNDRIDGVNIPFFHLRTRESGRGGAARLTWGDSRRNLAAGAEYGHVTSRNQQTAPDPQLIFDRGWDQGALFLNGTWSIGPVTLLPGVRYDHTGLSGETTSYTFGATWQATEGTLLRSYGARGFSLPSVLQQGGLMKVDSFQAGVESTDVPYLWIKGTYFNNRLRNIEATGSFVLSNQRQEGFEVEARTVPRLGFSLTGGYTFLYANDTDTGERLQTSGAQTVPPHLLKLGLLYDGTELGLRGAINGNYVAWNAAADQPAAGRGMVWDLHLAWRVQPRRELSPELFFSGRNLFSNAQTFRTDIYPNPDRWFEGGVRWRF